jgi:hypothetical protein
VDLPVHVPSFIDYTLKLGHDLLLSVRYSSALNHPTVATGSVAVPQLRRLVAGFPSRQPGFNPKSGHVGFVVDEVALGQVSSEYFGFSCRFLFHQMLHTYLSPGAGPISQLVADLPSGLSLIAPHEIKKNNTGSAAKLATRTEWDGKDIWHP